MKDREVSVTCCNLKEMGVLLCSVCCKERDNQPKSHLAEILKGVFNTFSFGAFFHIYNSQTAMHEFFWLLTVLPRKPMAPEVPWWSLTSDLPRKWHQVGRYKACARKVPLPPEKSILAAAEHTAEWHKNISKHNSQYCTQTPSPSSQPASKTFHSSIFRLW